MNKLKEIKIIIWVLSILIISINMTTALDLNKDVYIDFHSVSLIREGYTFPASITIRNLGESETLEIKKIIILDDNKKVVKIKNIDKIIKSLKNLFKREKELRKYLQKPKFCESPQLIKEMPEFQEYMRTISEIKNETFRQSFELDIRDFDDNIKIGKIINVSIEIEIKIGNDNFIISRENLINIASLLPTPSHNSPGWYVGDQHMHSEFGTTFAESPDPLDEMVYAANVADLDWVIFTDHSPAFSQASEWEDGYDACVAESTSSFKCLYGQEMSIGEVPWWCDTLGNSHYLAYPYTDDDLGWIDGYCGIFQCECRLEQPVVNEINNAGGMGFIAHPHNSIYGWEDWTVIGWIGFEIINGNWGDDDETTITNFGGDTDSWREFLQSETNPDNGFVVGIANSDAHFTEDVGNSAFTYCYMDSLSTANIRNAIKDGHCVASTGPFVEFTLDGNVIGESVDVPSGTNTLSITALSNAEFGNLEWLLVYVDEQLRDSIPLSGTSYSDSVDINLDTSDDYIRLEVYTDTGKRAYTNPIWVDVTSCSCSSWSEGSCGGGSCNSEQKQWTRTCTPSACVSETKCEYDADCEEGEGEVSECTEPGYEFCWESWYEDCTVSIAVNMYENVNNIKWGVVNDAWDPYVVGSYTFGWKGVDTEHMYYGDNIEDTCEYGGCDAGSEVNEPDTMVTTTAPNTADRETILGYDETVEWACWLWNPTSTSFIPNYGANNPIYVLNCFDDGDCSSNKYCDKSSSWSNWACVNDKSNGQSCEGDAQCISGYCDDDSVGLSDDNWCFTPYNTYFDGQETSYCDYSTGLGNVYCDERQVGEDLNLCIGTSYYEEECNNTCQYQDITSVFECTDAGCSCSEFLCDGLTTGSTITTCSSGETYFADKCTSTAGGEDRGDNICRSSEFASDCTADFECNGITAGTGKCNETCKVNPQGTTFKLTENNENITIIDETGNMFIKGCLTEQSSKADTVDNEFILRDGTNEVFIINSTGDLDIEGSLFENQATITSTTEDYIIKNSTNSIVALVNQSGSLFLKGYIYEDYF